MLVEQLTDARAEAKQSNQQVRRTAVPARVWRAS